MAGAQKRWAVLDGLHAGSMAALGLCLYLAGLGAVLLWPYRFDWPNAVSPNGALWVAGSGLTFDRPGLALYNGATEGLYDRIRRARGITLEVWADPATVRQGGPARLVSSSSGTGERNFMIGQNGSAAVLRLRTSGTDPDGSTTNEGGSAEFVVPGVFPGRGLRHLVFTDDLKVRRAYVDGRMVAEARSPGGNFANWSDTQQLFLGNEATGTRPWLGRLALVNIYDRVLGPADVAEGYRHGRLPDGTGLPGSLLRWRFSEAGPDELGIEIAPILKRLDFPVQLVPYREIASELPHPSAGIMMESAANILLFAPLGFLLCGLGIGGRRAAAVAVLAGVLLASAMESAQIFLEPRSPSVTDIVNNGLGTALGAILWHPLAGRHARRPTGRRRSPRN